MAQIQKYWIRVVAVLSYDQFLLCFALLYSANGSPFAGI
jgi:hypothetical protein